MAKFKTAQGARFRVTNPGPGGGGGGMRKRNLRWLKGKFRRGGAFDRKQIRKLTRRGDPAARAIGGGASFLNRGGLVGKGGNIVRRYGSPLYREEGGGIGFEGIEDVTLPSGKDVQNANPMNATKMMTKMMAHLLDEMRKAREQAGRCCESIVAAISVLPQALGAMVGGGMGRGRGGPLGPDTDSSGFPIPLTHADARAKKGTDKAIEEWDERFGPGGAHPMASGQTGQEFFDQFFGEGSDGSVGANIMSGGANGMDDLLQLAMDQGNPDLLIAGANMAALQATQSGQMGGIQAQGMANQYLQQNLPQVAPGANFNYPDEDGDGVPDIVKVPDDAGPGAATHPTSFGAGGMDLGPVTDILTRIEACVCSIASNAPGGGGFAPSAGGGPGAPAMNFTSLDTLSTALSDFTSKFENGMNLTVDQNVTINGLSEALLASSNITVNVSGMEAVDEKVQQEVKKIVGNRLNAIEQKLGVGGGGGSTGPMGT